LIKSSCLPQRNASDAPRRIGSEPALHAHRLRGPPSTKTSAVKGHEFGLDLSKDGRKALIAFLWTL
jgi:hypothetical protein